MNRNVRMVLIEENLRTPIEICPSATFAAANLIWTAPVFKAALLGEWSASNCLNHGRTETINTPVA